MTDDELDRRLDGWQVEVGSVTDAVLNLLGDTPPETVLLADLLKEVRALQQEMQTLRAEVAGLRQAVASEPRATARPTIKGYPLLPFAAPQDEVPFFQ